MSNSIKLKNNKFWDSSSIVQNRKSLKNIIDGILQNPIGEFVIWEGNVLKTGDGTWTYLCTFYILKEAIEAKFPLKIGFKRTAKIYIEQVDDKTSGSVYIRVKNPWDDNYIKEYLFGCTWGSADEQIRGLKMLDFDYNGLPYGHKAFYLTPDFDTGGNVRIYKIGLLLYDTLE